ncbi:MAG TPA: XRE family transcriptional regulator [Streptosporangiaceae bacterium]
MDVDLEAVGARVREARNRAGLSQRDVEAEAGISQPMLHRIEVGKRTSATLSDIDRLAAVLGVGLDELLYGSAVERRVQVAARAGGCAVDDLKAALDQGIELLKIDDRLDSVMPQLRQLPASPQLAGHASGSPARRGQVVARRVREALGFGIAPIGDLVAAIERLTGIDVGTMPLPPGVAGVCAVDPERATSLVLVNSNDVAERQRFTLAHELAHLVMGGIAHVDAVGGHRTAEEVLCDEFAWNLVLPADGVRAWLTSSGANAGSADIDERLMALMARYFGASPEVTRIQLDRMGLLPGQFRDAALPTGRQWAYRYGWGPQFDSEQAAARQPRVPRRILDRAVEAYRVGKLGISVLARIQNQSAEQVEEALAGTGVKVGPQVRRADVGALIARSSARGNLASRSDP